MLWFVAENLVSKGEKMNTDYVSMKINPDEAARIAWDFFQLEGEFTPLPGEIDFNFRIRSGEHHYLLKISRPNADQAYIEFQRQILDYIFKKSNQTFYSPEVLADSKGNFMNQTVDSYGNPRFVRLLSWIPGRLWSSVNPQNEDLLHSLGKQAGLVTHALQGFDHPAAHRFSEWDTAQGNWTLKFVKLFKDRQHDLIVFFQQRFSEIQAAYQTMRRSVVHNDVNDNNIIVTNDMIQPEVQAIIDYGDAVHTQTINDLAITIAYAIMNKPDVLGASLPIVKGYHDVFPLRQDELAILHTLVGMRLVISVTKAAINLQKEPDNSYLQISQGPAWDALGKWMKTHERLAHYSFRTACGLPPHPEQNAFKKWVGLQTASLHTLFPDQVFDSVFPIDMRIESTWLGHESEFNDPLLLAEKLQALKRRNTGFLVAGGYLETRPFYCTDAYKKESNMGPAYRSDHLGIDFWVEANTPIHSLFQGKVFSLFNNANDKDYGPALILEHRTDDDTTFYSLYGHLTESTLSLLKTGQMVEKGDLIGFVGLPPENGNWAPHLHFQLILDLLGYKHDFPGVAIPKEVATWSSLCPDPNGLFREPALEPVRPKGDSDLISYRGLHLGKSLSLSYSQPLRIVRGSGVFLIDNKGNKYLDTVNNVAHVGHEHPRVVKAGQEQMAVLNTNSRYLHDNINEFAKELLATFPEQLSVVHFVNSGSEANELALRMARTCSGNLNMIAVEMGYHGNTNACIDISSYKFEGKGGKGAPETTRIVPLPDAFRGLYRGKQSGPKYAQHVQHEIDNLHSKGRNLAGFICESIISCGGQIELPEDYLATVYKSVRQAGGLCIADEVQVGCGRTGSHFWGFQLHGVIPDIVTIGKPIGNGHPLAAVVCTQKVADAFANGMEYFNTFGGNPVSCAIGREVLRVIKDEHLQRNALETGTYLKAQLKALQKKFHIIGDVRGQGLFLGIELTDEKKTPLADQTAYLANRMKDFSILMSTDGRDHNVLKIKPPLVFSKENADELLLRLKNVLSEDFMRI